MSSRIFQSVIVQMKEATDRMIGVIDADSNVISCSDLSKTSSPTTFCPAMSTSVPKSCTS